MQKFHTSIFINAPKDKVWHAMLDDETYRKWTAAFSEGSYYEGSWEKGSEIRFLGPDPETGKTGGMVSEIADNKPYEFISIKHVGIIENGIEDRTSEKAQQWTPSYENYTFTEKDGGTEVQVDVDIDDEHADMFAKMWADGLQSLKNIAENEQS